MELARWSQAPGRDPPLPLTIAAGLAVGALAIAFAQTTDQSRERGAVLRPGGVRLALRLGRDPLGLDAGPALLFKGLAWSISLGSFRGGPTFPAIFLGVVAGLLAAHLPGFAETQAVAVLVGAMCVSILRLPLSSVMIALLLTVGAGLAVAPLIIVAVVVAYLTSLALTAYVDGRIGAEPAAGTPRGLGCGVARGRRPASARRIGRQERLRAAR